MGRYSLLWGFLFLLVLVCSCVSNTRNNTRRADAIFVALSEVRRMDSCRVMASNREFYLHKYNAEKIITKYVDSRTLNSYETRLLTRARSGLAFAYADYLSQIGKHYDAYRVMHDLASNTTINLYSDTTLWLNFLYHQGKVHYRPYLINKNKETILRGYDYLIQGYILSSRLHDDLYKGKYMLVLSMYFLNDSIASLANESDRASIRYINEDNVPDSLLAGNLADRSLSLFLKLNQPYYTAQAWLGLAKCYFKLGDAPQSIQCLNMALANPAIDSMPDLRATISEQLSLAYAAVGSKHNSDVYRNEYLDLQDSTRQDRELEARGIALEESSTKLWSLVLIAAVIFVLLGIVTAFLTHVRKKKEKRSQVEGEEVEEMQELLQAKQLQLSNAMRSAVEQRARLSVVVGMVPLIDRMAIAINKRDYEYAKELADEVDRQNQMLTQWIKMRKGIIQPRIETFALKEITDVVVKNTRNLASSGITFELCYNSEDIKVKADKTLTLFIINTLIDNARKAIETKGTITVTCEENREQRYAEISVEDTGRGMTEEQVTHLFEYKIIKDNTDNTSHGFGLVNCRGVIDRYRKISSLFSVCDIKAYSVLGKGTKVLFRIPLAIKLLCVILSLSCITTYAQGTAVKDIEATAARYCDSLYKCNVDGRYTEAMLYADSCYAIVKHNPKIDVGIRLSLYNETAVAALALHQWDKYAYFNYYYTNLYKEYTSDSSIATYCEKMARNEYWANISIIVMALLLLCLIPIFWFTYLRHIIKLKRDAWAKRQALEEDTKKTQVELDRLHITNNIMDNQLSALKHETMYYPVRIKQLLTSECGDETDVTSTVDYYRELYKTLSLRAMNGLVASFTFKVSSIRVTDLFKLVVDNGTTVDELEIVTNKELMDYLLYLLRRNNGGKSPKCTLKECKEGYLTLRFSMLNSLNILAYSDILFSTETPNVEFLIMRQIIREVANSTLCYSSGITAEREGTVVAIMVTLPRGRKNAMVPSADA